MNSNSFCALENTSHEYFYADAYKVIQYTSIIIIFVLKKSINIAITRKVLRDEREAAIQTRKEVIACCAAARNFNTHEDCY